MGLIRRYSPSVACAIVAVLMALLTTMLVSSRSDAAVTSKAQHLSQLQAFADQELQTYMSQPSDGAIHTYTDGTWSALNSPTCWYCYDLTAGAAAVLGHIEHNAQLRQVAITTFNKAIASHQLPSGAFTNDSGAADELVTTFFSGGLGFAYLELKSDLDPDTAARWQHALAASADYLISSGASTWYINGNINLGETWAFWAAYAATGEQKYLDAYNQEWAFTIAPPQKRWTGYGLQYTKVPTRADGSDGAGYLAESNGGTPGFDPNYTDAQLFGATQLYVATRDPRYLRLMNLEYNQLQPRIDPTWTLDATGGSRYSFKEPFTNPAVSVLAYSGGRPDLSDTDAPAAQFERIKAEYVKSNTYPNVNFNKGFAAILTLPLVDQEWPQGLPTATTNPPDAAASAPPAGPPTPTTPGASTAPVVTVSPTSTANGGIPGGTVSVTVTNAPAGSISVSLVPARKSSTPVKTSKKKTTAKDKTTVDRGKPIVRTKHLKARHGKVRVRLHPTRKTVKNLVASGRFLAVLVTTKSKRSQHTIIVLIPNRRLRHLGG